MTGGEGFKPCRQCGGPVWVFDVEYAGPVSCAVCRPILFGKGGIYEVGSDSRSVRGRVVLPETVVQPSLFGSGSDAGGNR
jgi:hypothetical protein